jgi:protein SCO1/2
MTPLNIVMYLLLLQNPDSLLTQIGIDQRLGAQLNPQIAFTDERGSSVKLGDFLRNKPVILTPVYYECPMLCSMLLNGLVRAMHVLPFSAGKEFEIVTFSIDPREKPELAAEKKQHYVRDYGKPEAASGWHFLTGTPESIRQLTDEIGFRYKYDEISRQWAHTSTILVLTPNGTISQYFYGIEFDPGDLRISLVQASNQKIGSIVDHVLLYCYQYDASTGKYSLAIMRVVRLSAVATMLGIVAFMVFGSRRRWVGRNPL